MRGFKCPAAFGRFLGLWIGCGGILTSGRRTGQGRAKASHVRGRKTLINSMNRVAGMSDVSLGLGAGVSVPSQFCNHSYASAMEAEVSQSNSFKKLRPFFGCVNRQIYHGFSLFSESFVNQSKQVLMKWCGVYSITFRYKRNGLLLPVDLTQWAGGFRYSASSTHGNGPRFLHPFVLFGQCLLNLDFFLWCYFVLLLGWVSFESKSNAWVSKPG